MSDPTQDPQFLEKYAQKTEQRVADRIADWLTTKGAYTTIDLRQDANWGDRFACTVLEIADAIRNGEWRNDESVS